MLVCVSVIMGDLLIRMVFVLSDCFIEKECIDICLQSSE